MNLRTEFGIVCLVVIAALGGTFYGLGRLGTAVGTARAERFITSVHFPVNEAVQVKADGNIGIVTDTGVNLVKVRFWTSAGYTWVLFSPDEIIPLHRKTIAP